MKILCKGRRVDFAAWLREQMEEHHLNQPRLAELAGVNQSTVSNWLNGKASPSADKLIALSDAFGYDKTALLQMLGIIDPPHTYTPEIERAMRDYEKIISSIDDPEIRQKVNEEYAKAVGRITDLAEWLLDFRDALSGKR